MHAVLASQWRAESCFVLLQNYMFATDQGITLSFRRSQPQLWFFDLNHKDQKGLRLPLTRAPFGITMYAASRQEEDGNGE